MILNAERLKLAIADAGVSVDDLANAVVRDGLPQDRARAALGNWLSGSSAPKAKPQDLESLARALNVQLNDLVQFDATHRWARISARKARLVADMIRDEDVDSALSTLRFSKKRAAYFIRKTLDAAIASAEENDADVTKLVVSVSTVDEGPSPSDYEANQPHYRGGRRGVRDWS